jgi:hypothetical protein
MTARPLLYIVAPPRLLPRLRARRAQGVDRVVELALAGAGLPEMAAAVAVQVLDRLVLTLRVRRPGNRPIKDTWGLMDMPNRGCL